MSNLPALITFFGAVISALGGFWASTKPKPARVIVIVGLVISALGAYWASKQQDSFNLNLLNKSEEIARLNQEVANSVSGGDSFCYLVVSTIDPVTNTGRLVVVHQGEHSLYDVHVRIVDLEKLDQIKGNLSFATLNQTDTNISIGNLISSFAQMLQPFTLGNSDTRRFNIFFSARNGFFNQALRFKKIDGKWVYATKVEREDKVIYEKVNDEFPRNAEGNVEW